MATYSELTGSPNAYSKLSNILAVANAGKNYPTPFCFAPIINEFDPFTITLINKNHLLAFATENKMVVSVGQLVPTPDVLLTTLPDGSKGYEAEIYLQNNKLVRHITTNKEAFQLTFSMMNPLLPPVKPTATEQWAQDIVKIVTTQNSFFENMLSNFVVPSMSGLFCLMNVAYPTSDKLIMLNCNTTSTVKVKEQKTSYFNNGKTINGYLCEITTLNDEVFILSFNTLTELRIFAYWYVMNCSCGSTAVSGTEPVIGEGTAPPVGE